MAMERSIYGWPLCKLPRDGRAPVQWDSDAASALAVEDAEKAGALSIWDLYEMDDALSVRRMPDMAIKAQRRQEQRRMTMAERRERQRLRAGRHAQQVANTNRKARAVFNSTMQQALARAGLLIS